MEVPNISLLFNKILFKRLDNPDFFKRETRTIHKKLFTLPLNIQPIDLLDINKQGLVPNNKRSVETFGHTTAWPGLLIGLGYGHSTGKSDDEFKNGFYFDFTTGLPVLPGSTVKGILRSFFTERFDIMVKDKNLREEVLAKKSNVLKRIISILKYLGIQPNESLSGNEWNAETIKELENIIFEGKVSDKKISSNIQDVFFEAFPKNAGTSKVIEGNIAIEYNGVFLGEDTITPHKHPLKDPVPLRFLKVLPGVTFQFQFFLNSIGISHEDKRRLFEELLKRFGVGAKSSVGFGKFIDTKATYHNTDQSWFIGFKPLQSKIWDEDVDTGEEPDEPNPVKATIEKVKTKIPEVPETDDWINPIDIIRGSILRAKVLSSQSGNLKILLYVKGFRIIQNLSAKGEINSIINVRVSNIEGSLKKGNYSVKVIPCT